MQFQPFFSNSEEKKKEEKLESIQKLFSNSVEKISQHPPTELSFYLSLYIYFLLTHSLTKQDVHELHFIFVYLSLLFFPH